MIDQHVLKAPENRSLQAVELVGNHVDSEIESHWRGELRLLEEHRLQKAQLKQEERLSEKLGEYRENPSERDSVRGGARKSGIPFLQRLHTHVSKTRQIFSNIGRKTS